MNVTLYNNMSENNVLNKTKNYIKDVQAVAKGVISIENPVVILDFDESILDCNYMYIADFDRYYFCSLTPMIGGKIEVAGAVDVLDSFANEILQLDCIINKQQNVSQGSMYFNDGSYNVLTTEFSNAYAFSGGFNDSPTNILICAGGD